MKRIFLCLFCPIIFLLSSCTPSCPLYAENSLYIAESGEYIIKVTEVTEGNCGGRVNDEYFIVEAIPLTLNAEGSDCTVNINGTLVRLTPEGRRARLNGRYLESEIYFEKIGEAKSEQILPYITVSPARVEIKFLINANKIFIFCGAYTGDELTQGIIFDSNGEFIDRI